ncbi:hypothetical protein [Streptomyces sp. NPDC093094]
MRVRSFDRSPTMTFAQVGRGGRDGFGARAPKPRSVPRPRPLPKPGTRR